MRHLATDDVVIAASVLPRISRTFFLDYQPRQFLVLLVLPMTVVCSVEAPQRIFKGKRKLASKKGKGTFPHIVGPESAQDVGILKLEGIKLVASVVSGSRIVSSFCSHSSYAHLSLNDANA